jgi:hypothetical protein
VCEKYSPPSGYLFYVYCQDDYEERRIADYQPTTKTSKKEASQSAVSDLFNAIIGAGQYEFKLSGD